MNYIISLIPSNPDFPGGLKSYSEDFHAAVFDFNSKSHTMRNHKELRILEIEDHVLTLELSSDIELPAPAKSLRLFTQYLLTNSELQNHVYHGSLFRSVPTKQQLTCNSVAQSAEVEVMETLTRVLMGDLPHRKEIFSAIQTLLSCCWELEKNYQKDYLSALTEFAKQEAMQTRTKKF